MQLLILIGALVIAGLCVLGGVYLFNLFDQTNKKE